MEALINWLDHANLLKRLPRTGWLLAGVPVSYTHLTLPTNREV